MFIFTESNESQIRLTTADFTSWRLYDMLHEIPTEVTFIGQRESNSINIVIYHNNPITVCEVEASGRYFIMFYLQYHYLYIPYNFLFT